MESEVENTMDGKILLGLGQSLAAQGRGEEAEPLLRRAVELFERQFPVDDPWLLEAREAIGDLP